MTLNRQNIFLLDALGALISTIFLLFLLPHFQEYIGLPIEWLQYLGALAMAFMLYSSLCFFLADHENSLWLKVIMTMNALYCLLSLSLIYLYYDELTTLGLGYFLIEKIIVVLVIRLEYRQLH